MTVIADGIDLGASDAERYRHLRRIIENVLADTDPSMSRRRPSRSANARRESSRPAREISIA